MSNTSITEIVNKNLKLDIKKRLDLEDMGS